MQKILFCATLGVALSMSTGASAGTPYVGIEGGILQGRASDIDGLVQFSTSQDPGTPVGPAGPDDAEFDDAFILNYKVGHDVGILGGYDFGKFRLELELAHKRARFDNVTPDETASELTDYLNSGLNRPSAPPDPGAPGLAALTDDDFKVDGNVSVRSAMINGLLDVGVGNRISLYGGGGYGRAQVRAMGDRDSSWAWQYIVGVRFAVGRHVEFGLKHRYFNSGIVKLQGGAQDVAGNPNRLSVDGTTVDQTTSASLMPELEGEFRTRSLLASLTYNF